jgi:simple sugar transport system permease protein
VLTIQTLEATILFLGVPSAQSPVFFAIVVIVVVLVQSPRLHRWARSALSAARTRSDAGTRAGVAS